MRNISNTFGAAPPLSGEAWLIAGLIVLGLACVLVAVTIFRWAFGKHDGVDPHAAAEAKVGVEDLKVASHYGFTADEWMQLTHAKRAQYRSNMLTEIGWRP